MGAHIEHDGYRTLLVGLLGGSNGKPGYRTAKLERSDPGGSTLDILVSSPS